MDAALLARFDALCTEHGYASRSEAIRDLVREGLVRETWADPDAEVVGTVTIVYGHYEHELAHVLTGCSTGITPPLSAAPTCTSTRISAWKSSSCAAPAARCASSRIPSSARAACSTAR
jgi:hypothetical protein